MTFKKLSEYFLSLEETASRLKITEILAELFKECKEEEIAKICYLSLGRLLPQYEGLEFQMAEKMMEKAVAKALGIEVEKVSKEYKKLGDLGETGQELKKEGKSKKQEKLWEMGKTKDFSVMQVYERLLEIAKENGAGSVERKVDKMAVLIEDLDELSVRFIVRIPLGKLRLGFSEMTILDALSWMEKKDKSLRVRFEDAFNVLADIGEISQRAKTSGIRGVTGVKPKLGTPIIPALCQRLGTAEEIVEKLGKMAIEPKYDGTRLQVHFKQIKGDKEKLFVRIFTRNLENVTHMFPDLTRALDKEIKIDEAIFDGEGLGFDPKTDKYLPFQETIQRKRKYGIEEMIKEIPFKYFVFDILYYNGESLIQEPFEKRRSILEKIIKESNKTILISPQIVTDNAETLRKYHHEQIAKGLEGIVAKKWQSPYEPGRRNFKWVKLKQEETKKGAGLADTIDCVVMGVSRGKGKRADFGVGSFLVGVKKGENFVTVTNIGTGLSDEQFRELDKRSQKVKVKEMPENYIVDRNQEPDTWVEPKIVVEIQADNITQSPIHTAGLALRFPRLVRFRDDKSEEEITTVRELESLYQLQFGQEK